MICKNHLFVTAPRCSDEQEHDDEVAKAAAHHEQMEDLMTAEAWMAVIEDGQLQGIDDAADGVDDAAGQQPAELCGAQVVPQLREGQDADPAHADIQHGGYPFWAVDPEQLEDHAGGGDAPDQREQHFADALPQREHAHRRIAAGDQHEDHHVVDLLAQRLRLF